MTRTEGSIAALKMESATSLVCESSGFLIRHDTVIVLLDRLVQVLLFDPSLLCNTERHFSKRSPANT